MTKKSKKLGVKTNKTTVFDESDEAVSDQTKLVEIETDDKDNLLPTICETLDHLHLDLLILMRKTMQDKLNIEKSMTNGELHLSKSRYIMGHKNVSSLQLPTELSVDIDPSVTLEEVEDATMIGKPRLKLITEEFTSKNKSDDNKDAKNIQDPAKWFGVLVPRNLKSAQNNYRDALSWAVDCANNQIKMHQICVKIKQLTQMKMEMITPKTEKNEE